MSASTLARRGVLLAITAVSLYLLAPALLQVFGAYDKLDDFNPLWWIAMVALQVGSYSCMWAVQKIAMRAEHWGPVITSQLASNSFGRVVPGGIAAAGAMQYTMLARGGVPAAQAASGMTASSLLVFGILLALPLLAVPAILFGAPVDPGLGRAALIGGVVFVLLVAAGTAAILYDRPLLFSAGRWVLDYLTLLAALTAVHASPRPSTVLLAFCAAQFLGTLPLTPGGLGFVEAGLTGTLVLAGVGTGAAVVATLAYRMVSFWLPIPAGAIAAVIHRRRYGEEPVDERAAVSDPGGVR
jgi:uncharacterized membrane protein YbhN (UPF0104 family)